MPRNTAGNKTYKWWVTEPNARRSPLRLTADTFRVFEERSFGRVSCRDTMVQKKTCCCCKACCSPSSCAASFLPLVYPLLCPLLLAASPVCCDEWQRPCCAKVGENRRRREVMFLDMPPFLAPTRSALLGGGVSVQRANTPLRRKVGRERGRREARLRLHESAGAHTPYDTRHSTSMQRYKYVQECDTTSVLPPACVACSILVPPCP